jgi:hypothetical protein
VTGFSSGEICIWQTLHQAGDYPALWMQQWNLTLLHSLAGGGQNMDSQECHFPDETDRYPALPECGGITGPLFVVDRTGSRQDRAGHDRTREKE